VCIFFAFLTLSVCGLTLYFLSKDLSFITKIYSASECVESSHFFFKMFFMSFLRCARRFFFCFAASNCFSAAVGGAAVVQHII
jgi:hypothetical protein